MAGGANDGLYTYDLALADGGPRVPDVNDLGGNQFEDGTPPPPKGKRPHAGMFKQTNETLAGLCRIAPRAILWVEWDSGDSEWVVIAVDAMGTAVTAASITPTPIATGQVRLSWANGTLPPQSRKPLVHVTDADGIGRATAAVNQVDVFLKLITNTAANLSFAVEIR